MDPVELPDSVEDHEESKVFVSMVEASYEGVHKQRLDELGVGPLFQRKLLRKAAIFELSAAVQQTDPRARGMLAVSAAKLFEKTGDLHAQRMVARTFRLFLEVDTESAEYLHTLLAEPV